MNSLPRPHAAAILEHASIPPALALGHLQRGIGSIEALDLVLSGEAHATVLADLMLPLPDLRAHVDALLAGDARLLTPDDVGYPTSLRSASCGAADARPDFGSPATPRSPPWPAVSRSSARPFIRAAPGT